MLTNMPNLLIWGETRFYYCQSYKRKYRLNVDLIPNDWKHLLKTETTQKKNPL